MQRVAYTPLLPFSGAVEDSLNCSFRSRFCARTRDGQVAPRVPIAGTHRKRVSSLRGCSNMFKKIATLLSLGLLVSAVGARADSIVFDGALDITGFGFASATFTTRALTVQSHGPASPTEQGCVAPGTSGLISGSSACAPADGLVGGDEAPPINFPKQAAPTLSSLGIVSADEIGILFDAVQPQNASTFPGR